MNPIIEEDLLKEAITLFKKLQEGFTILDDQFDYSYECFSRELRKEIKEIIYAYEGAIK